MIKKITKTHKILVAEAIFVFGVIIYLFFSTAPNQIYPLSGMTVSDPNFIFEIENGEEVVISVDKNFTNPIVVKENSDILLPPGVYYWKVRSALRESEIQNFTIEGYVSLDLHERENNYELENTGNVDLDVTREKAGITSGIPLEVGKSIDVEKDDSIYEGEQS